MPKLYLLGGETVYRRSAKPVNESAFEDAGQPLNVLVFPWARASFDKKYRSRQILTEYFRSIGAQGIDFIEYGQPDSIAEKMACANVVYLTGGQPSILIERIKAMQLDQLLRSYRGVIVGRSAGALALCQKCVVTVHSNSRVKIVEGLGLVNITLKAHYQPQRDDEVLKHFSLEERIFAVPEGSALVYADGRLSAMGSVYLFNGGERRTFDAADL